MQTFLYTYTCHEDELPLCRLELRTLFGVEPRQGYLESGIELDPSRSPFMKKRLTVKYMGDSLSAITDQIRELELGGHTFKIVYVEADGDADYNEQRAIERELGAHVRGRADMRQPQRLYGIAYAEGRWLFGECRTSEAVWLQHNDKPQNYSTALSTRVARAVANIAVPRTPGVKAVDPCCGIGTVLIEALSMGIDIVGYDINPLAVRGARVNLAHFGMPDVVSIGDIRSLSGSYDAAIVDLPYNLCSKLSSEQRLEMLAAARRLAGRVVIIATETIDGDIVQAGLTISDRCVVRKGAFARQILVCS
ncbi:TRM11 family SAM-dependent methyltransferase [Paenibacillus xerothermodurans]|uniref:RNA methyltransferase n=1 Tax=Paenibacillus xerothermodurans TaxID=1977292 RepID=A0A2W1NAE8_PAEXE|nr:RNA methyltransferase [Paenibacillus xerothermodurans]PZE20650.1 RNA methyltransferase [Paenibacillus xerothermodurans]